MPILPSGLSQTWGQQSTATQARVGMLRSGTTRKKRKRPGSKAETNRQRRARAGLAAKRAGRKVLKKGSAAAKAWGKKMARLRKRR